MISRQLGGFNLLTLQYLYFCAFCSLYLYLYLYLYFCACIFCWMYLYLYLNWIVRNFMISRWVHSPAVSKSSFTYLQIFIFGYFFLFTCICICICLYASGALYCCIYLGWMPHLFVFSHVCVCICIFGVSCLSIWIWLCNAIKQRCHISSNQAGVDLYLYLHLYLHLYLYALCAFNLIVQSNLVSSNQAGMSCNTIQYNASCIKQSSRGGREEGRLPI